MPSPTPSPSPGTSPGAPKTSVPLNADGTPNLSAGSGVAVTSSAYSIWDIPQDLTDYLSQMSGGKLWFDTGKDVSRYQRVGAAPDQSTPVAVQKVKYFDSSYRVLNSPDQVMKTFAAMSVNDPVSYMALQKALAAGPWGKVNLNGVFDHNTEVALGNAMLQYVKFSMGTGVAESFTQYLLRTGQTAQQLGGAGTSLGSGGGGNQPFQPQVTDPDTIKASVQAAAQSALGRALNQDELAKFVSQFQGAQISAQQAEYNGTAGSINTPDLTGEAMAFAQQDDPKAYAQNQRQSYIDSLLNLLSGQTVRPEITPTPKV